MKRFPCLQICGCFLQILPIMTKITVTCNSTVFNCYIIILRKKVNRAGVLLQTYSEATWPFLHRVLVDRPEATWPFLHRVLVDWRGRWVVPARTNSQPQRKNETRRPFAGYLKTNVQLININQYLFINNDRFALRVLAL